VLGVLRRATTSDAALVEPLRRRARDAGLPEDARLSLLAAAPGAELSAEIFASLIAALDPEASYARRGAAAEILGRSVLAPAQLDRLLETLVQTGPLEIERLLPAFTARPDPQRGLALAAALKRAKARKALRVEDLRQRFAAFGPTVQSAAEELFKLFAVDRAAEAERLERLLSTLPAGDAKHGLVVFNGAKASCRACHKLGYVGGEIGPELSKIGSIRSRKDLLESVVFPSASFVRSYEPTLLRLADGRTVNGLVRQETPEELVLATGLQQEQRIAKRSIEARQTGTVSIMPAGLDQQLSPQELADLIAFLQSAK
jgi:putative heme-binding domain-containing protein